MIDKLFFGVNCERDFRAAASGEIYICPEESGFFHGQD
jgi:hypothetical protein